MIRATWLVLVMLLAVPLSSGSPVHAQDVSARDRIRRAIERFEAALATEDPEQRREALEAALAELDEANRLESEILIEWNLGRVEHELGRPVRALEHLERFLAGIPAGHPRRAEAEALAATLRARVALLWVETQVAGARVLIEGEVRATAPMSAPIRVAAGEVMVEVSAPGYQTGARRVRLAGETETHVRVELELEATALGEVRVRCPLLDVQITIDGEVRGTTPLSSTAALTPGAHELIAERPGYRRIRRTIHVELGTEQTIDVEMEPDPDAPLGTLILRLPTTEAELTIDGAEVDLDDELELPQGRHALELEVEGREDWEGEVDIVPGQDNELAPELLWQDDVFARLHDNAEIQRIAGTVVIATATAVVIAGAITLGWGIIAGNDDLGSLRSRRAACGPTTCTLVEMMELDQRIDYLEVNTPIAIGVGTALILVGATSIPIGTWLFLVAPSDDAIRARAHASLRVGPSGFSLSGAF